MKGLEWDIMGIMDYYRNKRSKTDNKPVDELPKFENEDFWFLRVMPRKVWNVKYWLKPESTDYNIYTRDVIGQNMYGKAFSKAKSKDRNSLTNILRDVSSKDQILDRLTKDSDNMEVLSLLDNGISFERLLGKEWDNDLSRSMLQQVQKLAPQPSEYFVETDIAKRGVLANEESRMTPSDAIRYMLLERIVKDPSIINNLVTETQAKALGYKFDAKKMPMSVCKTDSGEPLYDVAVLNGKSVIPSYTLDVSGGTSINDINRKRLNQFRAELLEATGAKLVKMDNSERITESKLGTVVKKIKNVVAKKFGFGESALNKSLTFYASPASDVVERTYALIRDIAAQSIKPMMRETEKLCVIRGEALGDDILLNIIQKGRTSQKLDNLPTYDTFNKNRDIILKVASSLIASQVVKMGSPTGLNQKERTLLSETFKVEAMQVLSTVGDKSNTWMMPLIASYVSMALPKFAKDMNVEVEQYGARNNIAGVKDLTEAVFGLVNYDAKKGLLTSQVEPSVEIFEDEQPVEEVEQLDDADEASTENEANEVVDKNVVIENIKKAVRESTLIKQIIDRRLEKRKPQNGVVEDTQKDLTTSQVEPNASILVDKQSTKVVEQLDNARISKTSESENRNILSQKDLSNLKYKLRAGQITKEEYYSAISGRSEKDSGTAIENVPQSTVKPVTPEGKVEHNAQAPVVEVVESKVVTCEKTGEQTLTEDSLKKMSVDELGAIYEGILKRKHGKQLGYVDAADGKKVFALAKYNAELKGMSERLKPAELPNFVNGARLIEKREKYIKFKNALESSDFDKEILKRASETIAKSLGNEYNDIRGQTVKEIVSPKTGDTECVGDEFTKQDVCGNIKLHFETRAKLTERVKEKGKEHNPRFVEQWKASESLEYTAEQIRAKVIEFLNENWEALKEYTAGTVYQLYITSVGKNNLIDSIRSNVLQPMVNTVYDDSKQLATSCGR